MGKSTKKRAVNVNFFGDGVSYFCGSLTAAAELCSKVTGRKIELYEVQRMADGKLKADGITVKDAVIEKPQKKNRVTQIKSQCTGQKPSGVLLRYPKGSKPLETGVNHVQR